MGGSGQEYTAQGHFTSWTYTKCAGQAAKTPPACKNATNVTDFGYKTDAYAGWYDVQGCGKTFDYCRWVGDCQPGGNPALRQVFYCDASPTSPSFWSCALAGSGTEYTPQGNFTNWTYTRGAAQGASAFATVSRVELVPQFMLAKIVSGSPLQLVAGCVALLAAGALTLVVGSRVIVVAGRWWQARSVMEEEQEVSLVPEMGD
jgi:hypothetical protein